MMPLEVVEDISLLGKKEVEWVRKFPRKYLLNDGGTLGISAAKWWRVESKTT